MPADFGAGKQLPRNWRALPTATRPPAPELADAFATRVRPVAETRQTVGSTRGRPAKGSGIRIEFVKRRAGGFVPPGRPYDKVQAILDDRSTPRANGMPSPLAAYLVVRRDDGYGDVFPLTAGGRFTLGRGPTNRIVLKDELCSREHAEVYQSDGRWVVRDLESLNGTRLNGLR